MTFKPGVSGNPAGRRRGSFTLLGELKRQAEDKDTAVALVAQTLEAALAGDSNARKLIFEYVIGKPKENQGEPQKVQVEWL